ncbi:MAG: hypothetical protein LBS67_07715 [Clostridiales Family XIII bacterium]|jgi:hypothetical protein|nr:hypothetical protein [Clostridiales Family XIII bacterium]
MNRNRENSAEQIRYYPNQTVGVCALCGSDVGSVHFKGRIVCEECLDIIKELY